MTLKLRLIKIVCLNPLSPRWLKVLGLKIVFLNICRKLQKAVRDIEESELCKYAKGKFDA